MLRKEKNVFFLSLSLSLNARKQIQIVVIFFTALRLFVAIIQFILLFAYVKYIFGQLAQYSHV